KEAIRSAGPLRALCRGRVSAEELHPPRTGLRTQRTVPWRAARHRRGENRFLSEDELKEPERLGLGDWVRWAGWVPSEHMPAFYRLADALLLPSLFESCGLPVLEAMA